MVLFFAIWFLVGFFWHTIFLEIDARKKLVTGHQFKLNSFKWIYQCNLKVKKLVHKLSLTQAWENRFLVFVPFIFFQIISILFMVNYFNWPILLGAGAAQCLKEFR
jgi:hypothetical protein